MIRTVLSLLTLAFLASCASTQQDSKTYLWVWERNEDLTFLDTSRFGVAFLTASCDVDTGAAFWTPRRQPLRIPPGTTTIPVIRLETKLGSSLDRVSKRGVVSSIVRHAKGASMIQLDFDATLSQRQWYSELIDTLRVVLPKTTKLSITALASWCISDLWIDKLPIVEAVPMLFDMGVDDENIVRYLSQGGEIKATKAQGVLGLAIDEQMPIPVKGKKLYLFSPVTWTKEDLDRFLKHYGLQNQ